MDQLASRRVAPAGQRMPGAGARGGLRAASLRVAAAPPAVADGGPSTSGRDAARRPRKWAVELDGERRKLRRSAKHSLKRLEAQLLDGDAGGVGGPGLDEALLDRLIANAREKRERLDDEDLTRLDVGGLGRLHGPLRGEREELGVRA
jgi:hypothetical protein